MNKTQRMILIVVIVVLVAMFLFPPMQLHLENGVIRSVGYRFLLFGGRPSVNVSLLFAQWIGVLIVGALAYFLAKGKQENQDIVNHSASNIVSSSEVKPSRKKKGFWGWFDITNLSGWYRIGIVLSLLWCLLIIGMVVYEYNINDVIKDNVFIDWIEDTTKKEIKIDDKGVKYELVPMDIIIIKYPVVISFIIIPIIAGWFLILTVILTIRWIRRGF